ncbi:unnamed protein product [Clonostachys chloroleuca]|uniref:Uncharacterized protein n=1 Tax=Clonostachys chloroleuca TaxID=1926264 RepID=A0AA35Q1U7_9HYPO|nr:unnamed protein product [Clonostachys chloroleuca]
MPHDEPTVGPLAGAPRRRGGSRHTRAAPREEPVRVPLDEIRQRLDQLDREHAEAQSRRRQEMPSSTVARAPASQESAQPREGPIRLRPDEVEQAWDEIKRQRAPAGVGHIRVTPRRTAVTVPEDELRRTITAITQQRAEERLRGRATRLRPQSEMGESARQGTEDAPRTQTPASAERVAHPPQVPTSSTTPQTPPPRKRPRDAQPGGLLSPPATRPHRPEKSPRLLQDIAPVQRKSLEAVLQYRESYFRDKEKDSVTRTWCDEVPLALQVETAKSFHQAFTDERTLPILHCSFCYRKQPHSELTPIHQS